MLKRLTIVFGLCCGANAQADEIGDLIHSLDRTLPESIFTMVEGDNAPQPIGHYELCQTTPSECAPYQTPASAIRLTAASWDKMDEINTLANTMIEPVSDADNYGAEEVWVSMEPSMGMRGDCEDIARLKIKLLVAEGFPDSALRIAIGYTQAGEGHAVVLATTDRGDFILDNLTPDILPLEESKIDFRSVQSSINAGQWKSANLQFRFQ